MCAMYFLAMLLVYHTHMFSWCCLCVSTTKRMMILQQVFYQVSVCNCLLVYGNYQWVVIILTLITYWLLCPFNICCIESLQCITCLIKFNSKRKLSNYIYRTTPLFLSTHQKISTKNDWWVSCISALLVKDMLEHCMASCLALLYIEITSYYYSGWSEQWQQTFTTNLSLCQQ